jgi:DNA invertase Pin-like site-specific DNA recombinase
MAHSLDKTRYAIVYPRQSTAEQVENNVYSLERQMQLRDKAIADGFPEDRVMVVQDDLGLSGRTITKRPGFTHALELIDQGEVAAIYVEDLTRLSRDERTIDQMLIADVCERAGARIYMGGSWYDMRDAGQRQSYKYQAVGAAEYWRAHLGKLQSARRQKAQAGKVATQSPRGYKPNRAVDRRHPDRDRLVPNEPDAGFIRAVVAGVLESSSLRSFYLKHSPLVWPDGKPLAFSTMQLLLTKPVYRGTFQWGDVVILDAHEAVITPEQAARLDAMRELNTATYRGRPADRGGVLAGLMRCAECGRKLKSRGSGTGHAYHCIVQAPSQPASEWHLTMSGAPVDALVLEAMWGRLRGDLIEGAIARLQEAKAQTAEVVDLNDRGRRALQRKVDGLVRTLADPDLTSDARKPLLAALDDATKGLKAVERQSTPAPHVDAEVAAYQALLADPVQVATLRDTWEDEPIQWRRAFIRRFVRHVEARKGKAGKMTIAVLWADGVTTEHASQSRARFSPDELAIVRAALASPECPATRRAAWASEWLRAQGYDRTEAVIAHVIRRLAKQEAACSNPPIDQSFNEFWKQQGSQVALQVNEQAKTALA